MLFKLVIDSFVYLVMSVWGYEVVKVVICISVRNNYFLGRNNISEGSEYLVGFFIILSVFG